MFIRLLIQLCLFWSTIHSINYLLLHFPQTKRTYVRFLRTCGCHISLGNIGFYTTTFNRNIFRLGTRYARVWKIWFTIGIFIALITAVCACLVLICLPLKTVYELLTSDRSNSMNQTMQRDQLLIQPIIPGVNVPSEQIIHFFLALLVCTVFHEFGHAVAASSEQIRVNGCGYFLYIIYPGAYVELNQEQVEMISAYRQLRIYCAGVFHNIILVVIAVLCLLVNPYFARNFYTESAIVQSVSQTSPLYNLLPKYSAIQSIDGCRVQTANDWYQCLRSIKDRQAIESSGYCLTSSQIQIFSNRIEYNQTTNHDCCQNLSEKLYCFLYQPDSSSINPSGACLAARTAINHPTCFSNADCQQLTSDSFCLRPFSADNVTRLIRISHDQGPTILFVGSIIEISRTITIQPYQAKYTFIPTIFITDFPLFLQYVSAFSFALAFFNAVPCYALDGQYILSSLFEYLSIHSSKQQRYALRFSTFLLLLNITIAFIQYFSIV